MGTIFSKTTENRLNSFSNFNEMVDYIATYYILTMDFESLKRLSEPEYCDNLIVITTDIVNKYFNELDIDYLAQRTKEGQEINDMTKDKIMFLTKNNLENLDIKNDRTKSIRKKRVCIGIAKFYITIANVYAAIITTINPVYTYKDQMGQVIKTNWSGKNEAPKDAKVKNTNICDDRIKALSVGLHDSNRVINQNPLINTSSINTLTNTLINSSSINPSTNPSINPSSQNPSSQNPSLKYNNVGGSNINDNSNNSSINEYNLNPNICSFNTKRNAKNLSQEPGISELIQLYYDKYDYSNGTFIGMSEDAKQEYNTDLKTFYYAFTGNKVMPPEITKFSDIMLRDFNSKENCINGKLKNPIKVSKNEKLFVNYAEHIKEMIKGATSKQAELTSILNTLFLPIIDPYTKEKKIRIHPNLTDNSLKKVVKKTRNIIVEMYSDCEANFVKGIELYEAIVETKIKDTLESQINNLEQDKKGFIDYTSFKI
jgi:hypothetical protein